MKNQHNTITQPPAVAGQFYPADRITLTQEVDALLSKAQQALPNRAPTRPKALIVPHAGYVYSGAGAAAAYVRLLPYAAEIKRIVLFGPAHQWPFRGLATASADQFMTPLGTIPIDQALRDMLTTDGPVQLLDQAFTGEHSLEVQLPFLQRVLGKFNLLPVVVGDAAPEAVLSVMEQAWGGDETLIVVSSDLSHFHDYATAEYLDHQTTSQIKALNPGGIEYEDACGRIPVKGLLLAAKHFDLQVETVAQYNSGDVGANRQRVVGYGAYVLS